MVSSLLFLSLNSSAQSAKENIDKKAKDPKTAENAAKADAYIIRNKKSIEILNDTSAKTEATDRKKSRKNCRKQNSK